MTVRDIEIRIRDATDAGALEPAATLAIETYGPEILGFLVAALQDESEACEAYAQFCEDFWRGLPSFRWACSLRTWLYVLARHAANRGRRDRFRRRAVPLSRCPEFLEVAQRVRSATLPHRRTDVRDRMACLRTKLRPDDLALLILRVDRGLSWDDVAQILERRPPALRKRYERIVSTLRKLAVAEGLLESA